MLKGPNPFFWFKPNEVMAKKPRKMGKYIRGNCDEFLALTTLAGNTLVSADFDETVNERTLVSSIVAVYSLTNFTATVDVGPILVLIAHSDYTSAEIEEWIEATGSWDEGNMIQQEIAKRKIRLIGAFTEFGGATDIQVLNDGKHIKTRLNWILNQGQTLKLCGYNRGTAAVATTVPDMSCQGHVNLFPK